MLRYVIATGKFALCYLLSGAASVMYLMWPHDESHPHAPFCGFPGFLVWSPMAPYLLVEQLNSRSACKPIARENARSGLNRGVGRKYE